MKSCVELEKNYTGKEVQELLDIVIEEANATIEQAYSEGYKQGVFAYKPDVEFWKIKAIGFERKLKEQKFQTIISTLGCISLGFIGGLSLGFAIQF